MEMPLYIMHVREEVQLVLFQKRGKRLIIMLKIKIKLQLMFFTKRKFLIFLI